MFSPATKRSDFTSATARKNNSLLRRSSLDVNDSSPSSVTPLRDGNAIPNRPSTGTPAPWASRLSVLARISPVKRNEKGEEIDLTQPVCIGEFPSVVREEQQAMLLEKHPHGDICMSGGLDKETSLAWVICRNKLFIWSYLSPIASRRCVVLDLPSSMLSNVDAKKGSSNPNNWFAHVINWDSLSSKNDKVDRHCKSAGIILCNRKTRALAYWPDIYSGDGNCAVTSYASVEELEAFSSMDDGTATPNKQQKHTEIGGNSSESSFFNSFIATPIPGGYHFCLAFACSSNGEVWQFLFDPSSIRRIHLSHITSTAHPGSNGNQYNGSKGYPRSLTWSFIDLVSEPKRQFLFLRDNEIQCFSAKLTSDFNVSKLWSHEIIGTDSDLGIQKDLAGQKRIWPLDLQVDNNGKVITILIAIFCKDRITSSSYTEYSLLTMQHRSGVNVFAESIKASSGKVLEKKAPIQVIIPKARVEDEEFLFSMRLKTGGKPAGSVIILSGDGTATVSHYWSNSTRLYQFDLPYDAGKVLDASVFPSSDDGEDGAWAVLTEKAGVWAIPERAVVLGGVEPPERSLSRKGSSNERSIQEDRKNFSFGSNILPRRASSEVWDTGDRQRAPLTIIARRNAQDEESEALINQFFHDFLLSGKVDGAVDKLRASGAFERDGETNAFSRTSKSIVDTLAKHWTTTRGAEIVALSVVSTQLLEKEQKHQKFLQFLALSKCHEELCSRQRQSLQIIMEHGEKLAGIIQLRELHNMICQSRANAVGSSHSRSETQATGALWDLIQLVGERARRKTVLLMDRENVEVFYSKVSDVEDMFYCLERHLDYLIDREMPFSIKLQRACEISNACVRMLQTAMQYRNEHHLWYPSLDSLTPWYCHTGIRNGLWSIASFMLQLVNDMSSLDHAAKSDFYSYLEVLAEVLLDSYSVAITAKIERGEDHKGLLEEYWKRRDTLLDSLYMQVKGFFQAKLWDSQSGTEDQNREILWKLCSSLLPIAKRHECYQTLWSICCDLNDLDLLRNLMHESMGPKGGFCNFVFKQMYDKKHYSKLMRLGEEFQEELANFLKQHPHLCWLHEIFLNQFSFASESLHTLAFSEEELALATEKLDSYCTGKSLADRKRLLNLSKIAAFAGKDTEYRLKVKRIEADLNILKLQEEIFTILPNSKEKQDIENHLASPVDLIELCIKSQNRMLALRAFDVFSWTNSAFLKCNCSLLEECWRNAANQDDWESIYQMSLAEGWSDEETLRVLSETILFQASNRCYGPEAKSFEGSFDEVLPLRLEGSKDSHGKDIDSSVEAILMQHKDFPDAGKLMLTAIMLGSVQSEMIDDDGPSPMD